MTWWHYLLLANVYLTLFFVFYTLFLRKETFFNLNRVYLVSAAILSFSIPVIQSDWIKNLFITQKVQETIYNVGPAVYQFTVTATTTTPNTPITLGQILGIIYLTGIMVLSFRFIYQLAVINWVINQAKSETTYSFFNQIKVEARDTHHDVITAHEESHARQWHSADILLLEAIMIINWFNPVVYLYRNAVKHIHEFIADRDALKAGTDKAEYAMLLLSQTFTTPPYHLISPFFNHSLLKQRIQMLQKSKSQRIMLAKYCLSAPLFALMLVLSSATVNQSKTITAIHNGAEEVFSTAADFDGAGNNAAEINQKELSEADKADLLKVIKQHEDAAKAAAADPNQTTLKSTDRGNELFTAVENSAEFPGGIEAFYKYLSANIRYPLEARQKNIQGKVFATFVVEKDGTISDTKIMRGIGGGADEEAVRLLNTMPKWTAGVQNGTKVRQQYTVPISFSLADAPSKTDADQGEIFSAVEKSAAFPGGIESFYRFLSKSVRYPAEARENHIQGKVFVSFVVEKDGALTGMKLVHDIGGGLGDEALRVMKQSPKWIPGLQNGKPVREQYTVPIAFTLIDAGNDINDTKRSLAHVRNNNPANAGTYSFNNNTAFTFVDKRPVVDTISNDFRVAMTSNIAPAALYAADGKIAETVKAQKITGQGISTINGLKEKAANNLLGSKLANGVVQMVTKHKPFFDQEGLTN